MLRTVLLAMSRSHGMERWIVNSRLTRNTVKRFVAGTTLDEAIAAAAELRSRGLQVTLDLLGESVASQEAADKALTGYQALLTRMAADGVEGSVSVKPTQLGLVLDSEACRRRLLALAARAAELGRKVEVDMEDSTLTQATITLYLSLKAEYPESRLALQAYLFRTLADVTSLIEVGGRVRLVKGAYREPPSVAMQGKRDVDGNFVACMDLGLRPEAVDKGFSLALGTHDDAIIQQALEWARQRGLRPQDFEFQFLYGIRTDLQESLVRQGWGVRVYVPFGESWYPYFMRRLAERPANLAFVLKQYFKG